MRLQIEERDTQARDWRRGGETKVGRILFVYSCIRGVFVFVFENTIFGGHDYGTTINIYSSDPWERKPTKRHQRRDGDRLDRERERKSESRENRPSQRSKERRRYAGERARERASERERENERERARESERASAQTFTARERSMLRIVPSHHAPRYLALTAVPSGSTASSACRHGDRAIHSA